MFYYPEFRTSVSLEPIKQNKIWLSCSIPKWKIGLDHSKIRVLEEVAGEGLVAALGDRLVRLVHEGELLCEE